MKLALAIFTLVGSLCLPTFASNGDATPTEREARQLALNHAMDNVFIDNLDRDSKVIITPISDDESAYYFMVVADDICSVVVSVSKETGLAFNDQEMTCNY